MRGGLFSIAIGSLALVAVGCGGSGTVTVTVNEAAQEAFSDVTPIVTIGEQPLNRTQAASVAATLKAYDRFATRLDNVTETVVSSADCAPCFESDINKIRAYVGAVQYQLRKRADGAAPLACAVELGNALESWASNLQFTADNILSGYKPGARDTGRDAQRDRADYRKAYPECIGAIAQAVGG
jgi:hypothetical protein